MNPTTVQNVVTYDAIIEFDNPRLQLFPGMTAYVTIPVASADDVVKIPNAALRFKSPLPVETVRALYAKYGVDGGTAESAVVWKLLPGGAVEPVRVSLGITDHTDTELARVEVGTIGPGDDVVTAAVTSKSATPGVQGLRR
jgi:HlyD family secretion protein